MASQVEIVNRALIKLGSKVVSSISDNVAEARVMSALWDTVRRAELRRAFWQFSLVRTSLPANSATPAWGYGYGYQLPADFLRLMQVNDVFAVPSMSDYREGDDSLYSIEGGQIYTDLGAPLKIRYVKDVTDPGAFDALFVESFAAALAAEACEKLTQSNQKKELLLKERQMALREGIRAGAIEKPPQGIPDDGWMLVRL